MSADYFTRVQASSGWGRILESFARFAAPPLGQSLEEDLRRALDVGCGPGALVRHLAQLGCRAVGVDADPAMIVRARELAAGIENAEFRQGDVLALPFADEAFELVTATNVIFLLPDPLAGLKEMARVCCAGGTVAMLNPSPTLSRATAQAHAEAVGLKDFDAFSLANWGSVAERHHRLSPADLGHLFQQAGLHPPQIAGKIGPGLALFAKASK